MALNWAKSGINHVPSYQISGIPYVTSSNLQECTSETSSIKVEFPYVASWFIVQCTGSATNNGTLKFGFSNHGVTGRQDDSTNRFFVLKDGQSTPRLEIRCKELYFARSGSVNTGFNIIAGLTTIESGNLLTLTGSSGFSGVG